VFGLGGGSVDNKKFKAVQIGGTSGGFIPEEFADTQIDFDSMSKIGAALGTGAVFVMDETRDIVDIVTRITKFFEHESAANVIPAVKVQSVCMKWLKESTTVPVKLQIWIFWKIWAASCQWLAFVD
jgi:NADH:ubiquinone oxidoreductase subunit F (NADH-binding)